MTTRPQPSPRPRRPRWSCPGWSTPLALGLLLLGCTDAALSPETVARLGEEEVTYGELAAYVERQTDSPPAGLESAVLSELLDQYIEERLLTRTAIDRGLVAPGTDHRTALAALIDAAPEMVEIPGAEEARYRARAERFALPERVELYQILTDTREQAEAAAAALAAGQSFADVTREHSLDPSAPYGGRQGQLAYDDLPEGLAGLVFGLAPGEVSEIVRAEYGFLIFRVGERLPAEVTPFEEAAPELREELRQEAVERWLESLVEEAESRYTVRLYERKLPFDYLGSYPVHD